MRIRKLQPLFLALALILGQAAALAHTSQHPLASDGLHTCSLCLLQHNLDHAPPTPAAVVISFHLDAEAPLPTASIQVLRSTDTHYPIRAPPVSV